MQNVTCPKRFIFFRVGFLTTGRLYGTHLPQHNQNVQADHAEMLVFIFSVICGVVYTLQYLTHVSVGSSSSSSKKKKDIQQ